MKAKLAERREMGDKVLLTFETKIADVGTIPEGDLDLIVKKWRSPRSRDALNYSWQIITEIAEKMSIEIPVSKDEVYKRLVNDYGELARDEANQLIKVVLKAEIDPMSLDIYLHSTPHTTTIDNTLYRLYYVVKPPHEYNTQEFARFIDHIKHEAREIGIEI